MVIKIENKKGIFHLSLFFIMNKLPRQCLQYIQSYNKTIEQLIFAGLNKKHIENVAITYLSDFRINSKIIINYHEHKVYNFKIDIAKITYKNDIDGRCIKYFEKRDNYNGLQELIFCHSLPEINENGLEKLP